MKQRVVALGSVLSFAVGVASGCGAGLSGPSPGASGSGATEEMVLRGPGSFEQVRIDGRRFFGPNIEVEAFDDGIRGRARNTLLDVREKDDKVSGILGAGAPVNMVVIERAPHLHARGLWGGMALRIELDDEHLAITGAVCGYSLTRADDSPAGGRTYAGRDGCGRTMDRVELTLPASFGSRTAAEQVVLLALVARPVR
jgi:hypothetical protein